MNPLAAVISTLFHMYAAESLPLPPPSEQVIYSRVIAQLSLRHNLEHSPAIVLSLFRTVSDGRGSHREDFRVKDEHVPHAYL